ncbi:MAG: zinc-dependent metalloprotease [Candidatus Latescibacterota bacterium]
MQRYAWMCVVTAVLLPVRQAPAYKIFLDHDQSTTWEGQTVHVVNPNCTNDVNWTNGKTTENVGIDESDSCPGASEPPIFWDLDAVYFYLGAGSEDMEKTAQASAVQAALGAWENAGSNLDVRWGGSNTKTFDPDDNYSVLCFGRWGQLGTDVGKTLFRLNRTGGDDYGEIAEVDIVLNDAYYWTIGTFEAGSDTANDAKDIQSIGTHELGHGLGLAHSRDPDNACVTMHPKSVLESQTCVNNTEALGMQTLQDDDKDGLKEIYGPSGDGYYVRSELGADKPVASPATPTLRTLSAFPNPFNPKVVIAFTLERPGVVSLAVSDLLGQEVARLIWSARYQAGAHVVTWEPGEQGRASGVYLVRLMGRDWELTRKVTLVR